MSKRKRITLDEKFKKKRSTCLNCVNYDAEYAFCKLHKWFYMSKHTCNQFIPNLSQNTSKSIPNLPPLEVSNNI